MTESLAFKPRVLTSREEGGLVLRPREERWWGGGGRSIIYMYVDIFAGILFHKIVKQLAS